MSRASNLAGFVSAIYPEDNLSVGFLTARNLNVTGISTFAGSIDIQGGVAYAQVAGIATYAQVAGIATYADVAGIATVAQGLTGTPDINAGSINSSGVVTATAFVGDGSGLSGVGGGLGQPVNDTFNTVGLVTTFNSTINLNDANAGVGSHFVTVTSPILELGPSGDVTVGADKILVVDPVQLAPWS